MADSQVRPPLTSLPSTPGPQVPGGYPRNSVVFATNQWESHSGGAGLLAAAKTYLPAGVAGYFPDVPTLPAPSMIPSPDVHTPYPRDVPPLLHTDSVASVYSAASAATEFSTRAYAGSGSSRLGEHEPASPGAASSLTDVPTPGVEDVPAPVSEHENEPADGEKEAGETAPRPRATSGLKASHPGVAHPAHPPLTYSHLPVNAVAAASAAAASQSPADSSVPAVPPAPTATNPSTTTSATTTPSTAPSSPLLVTPPPSSPASPAPASPKSPKLLARFASLRRGKAMAPPSAFHARGASVDVGRAGANVGTHARGASLDSASPSPASPASSTSPASSATSPTSLLSSASPSSPNSPSNANANPSASPTTGMSRRKSLLRTLRGEAKLLAGRVRRGS